VRLGGVSAIPKPDYRIRLGALLALDYIELDVVAFFERFVSIQLDCRIVDEYIRPVFASDESVALGVVKPLDLPFVLSHSFLPSFFCCLERRALWGKRAA
jgi:hypothetical protein